MKNLIFTILLLFGSQLAIAQCPINVDCDSNKISLEFLSVPNGGDIDSLQVNVQSIGPVTLIVDSVNNNTLYVNKGNLSCTDIIVITEYYDNDSSVGKCSQSYTLPVELIYFNYEVLGTTVILYWRTANEINNKQFDLEKSVDHTNWVPITTIKGAGNSFKPINYSFVDEIITTTYYRLKQIDFDGKFTYSRSIATHPVGMIPIKTMIIDVTGKETNKYDPNSIIVIQYSNGTILKQKIISTN